MAMLYSDNSLLSAVEGSVIFEGQKYYLDVEQYLPLIIEKWIDDEGLEGVIESYHRKNRVLILRFENVVGFVNILGKEYDVRSRKIYDSISGNEQFQNLLNDITELYSKFSFNYRGTAYAKRDTLYEYNLDDLDVFDYYYQLAYMFPKNINLDTLISQCLRSPNTINKEASIEVKVEKSKMLSAGFYNQLGKLKSVGTISESHSLANSAFAKITQTRIGKKLIPLQVSNITFEQTTNTTENRFLKFFLEEINALCIKLSNQKTEVEVIAKAKKLQRKVSTYLLNPFFKKIQRLTFVPSSSAVLLKKAGYKDIYYHFVQSKFAFTPILDNQKKYALKYGLKNIAALYELWVFIKVAYKVFGEANITETFEGQVSKYGSKIGAYKWKVGNIQLFYNKSYTKLSGGSYSVTLRPDITLNINDTQLYLLDAKYKFNSNNREGDSLVRIVKQEDIHKMHAYLDAIPLAKSAIVIYPGTESVFYNKPDAAGIVGDDIFNSGVGAFPLSPKDDVALDFVIKLLKEYSGY
jgi:uncharacterized protein